MLSVVCAVPVGRGGDVAPVSAPAAPSRAAAIGQPRSLAVSAFVVRFMNRPVVCIVSRRVIALQGHGSRYWGEGRWPLPVPTVDDW